MKLLTTLILMTVSTLAFAERKIEPTFNSHLLITEEQHNHLEAKYQDLIHEVNTSLSGPRMHQSVIVNATSESVAYKYIPCNLEVPEIKERCLNTRRKLASALSYDVSISKEYEKLYWESKKEYYKDSVISKFLMTPIVMSPEEQKLKEAEFKKRQAERQENHNTRIAVIGWILLIISVLVITTIISLQLMLWLPTVPIYISFIYSYIHYRIYGIKKTDENDEDNQQQKKQ